MTKQMRLVTFNCTIEIILKNHRFWQTILKSTDILTFRTIEMTFRTIEITFRTIEMTFMTIETTLMTKEMNWKKVNCCKTSGAVIEHKGSGVWLMLMNHCGLV